MKLLNLMINNFFPLEYKREKRNKILKYEFKDIINYLCFYMENDVLYASYFSHNSKRKFYRVSYELTIEDDKRKTKLAKNIPETSQSQDEIFMGSASFDLQMICNKQMSFYGIEMEP